VSRLLVAQRALTVPGWAKDALWRRAQAIPSLDLRFAENKSLVDATTGSNLVTFTRASSGTFVGSDGVIKTAVTNLLSRSQEFNTTWINRSSTDTADTTTAPDGTSTADTVTVDGTTDLHSVFQDLTIVSGATYALSVFLKYSNKQYATISITRVGASSTYVGAGFDIQNGTITTAAAAGGTGTAVSSSISNLGNGWYRCSVIGSIGAFTDGQVQIAFSNDGTTLGFRGGGSYAGNSSDAMFLWGAQLEQSSTVGEYIPTTSTINSAPRFDHNPVTGESLGLLVEEQRSNLLLNSGTLSTQSVTVAAVAHTLSFTGTGTITLTGVSTAGPLVGTGTGEANRVSLTFTPTAGSLTLTVSGTVTNAQLEAGAFQTSYIATTGAAVTRSADVCSDTTRGGNIRSLYVQFRSPASGTRPVVSLDDNSANERIEILTSGTDPKLLVTDGGSAVADLDAGTVSANTTARIAARFNTDDYAISINGATSQLDAAGTLPTATRIRIGSNQAGGYLNGTIARITGWESALPLLPPVSG
jgi:hypothetical protein